MTEKLQEGSMYSHFEELRKVLLYSLVAVLAGSIISYVFLLDYLMDIFMTPINNLNKELVFIAVGEGFITQMKICIFGGIIIASPIILWQIISYIIPALYENEKKVLFTMLFFSTLLFVTGVSFGYLFIIGLGLKMLLVTFSAGLTPMISVSSYISFVFWFLIPFGVIFEIPIFVYFLTKIGLITPNLLIKKRKYVMFCMFFIAALLTPPDVITQIFLALPMIVLYEVGIWISKGVAKGQRKKQIVKEGPGA